jgi:hypothetical protein
MATPCPTDLFQPPPARRPLPKHVGYLQYYSGCDINCLYWRYCIGNAPGLTILVMLYLRLSRSRFCTPQKYKEKNSKVGNFSLCNSYVKCVLKLNWHGWRGSYLSLLQLQSSPELSGALQSVPCSQYSFHLSTPC